MVWRTVGTVEELLGALRDGERKIELTTTLTGMGSLMLPPGVSLRGGGLEFGAKGLRLSSNNTIENLSVTVPDHEIAIYNDTSVKDLGTLTLRGITVRGQIYLQASNNVRSGTVHAKDIHVAAADTRGRFERPTGFGVEALQGAFTLWNRQSDAAVVLHARLENISAGSSGEPVRGSGVFVGGHMDAAGKPDGGTVAVELLSTGDVHSDGGIAPGTPDLISGGVFVISGAEVDEVQNLGSTTTYGQNDMVLDNWGSVRRWNATAPVTSHGPSGIGFVNFGDIGRLNVSAAIETHGLGARGFNVYDGSLQSASFKSIATYGDGSVGVQVSRELPELTIAQGIMTKGGTGRSLVKGVMMDLSAIALSVKPTGHVGRISIGGDISTEGVGVVAVELEGGVDVMDIGGQIEALGAGADGIRLSAQNAGRLALPVIKAEHGQEKVVIS